MAAAVGLLTGTASASSSAITGGRAPKATPSVSKSVATLRPLKSKTTTGRVNTLADGSDGLRAMLRASISSAFNPAERAMAMAATVRLPDRRASVLSALGNVAVENAVSDERTFVFN